MLLDTTYNYVIFGADGYYDVGYADIKSSPNVLYMSHYMQTIRNPFMRVLTRLTFSHKVNHIIRYPFSSITFKHLLNLPFTDDKPLCFLFFGNVYWCTAFLVEPPYFDYLKQRYPNARFGMYLQDIVARNTHLDMKRIKEQFDFVLSYDQGDCAKYDLIYHPTPYSAYVIPQDDYIARSDVYFCGSGKQRYEQIHSLYEQCTARGLQCDFYISGVPASEQKHKGIHYNHPLSYLENLQHVQKTKCIVEIMQSGAHGFTPRLWESMFYNKHLLTNNEEILSSPYYQSKSIHLVNPDMDRITEWIDTSVKPMTDALREELSPKKLIQHIESHLRNE